MQAHTRVARGNGRQRLRRDQFLQAVPHQHRAVSPAAPTGININTVRAVVPSEESKHQHSPHVRIDVFRLGYEKVGRNGARTLVPRANQTWCPCFTNQKDTCFMGLIFFFQWAPSPMSHAKHMSVPSGLPCSGQIVVPECRTGGVGGAEDMSAMLLSVS